MDLEEINEFNTFLAEIIKMFDDDVQEIINKVIENGKDSLSDEEKEVFEDKVESEYIDTCPSCEQSVSFSNMAFVIENNRCASCQHNWNTNYAEEE